MYWFFKGCTGVFDLCQTDFSIYSKLTVSPLFLEVIHGSTTFKLIKGYQRLKKNDTIQFWCFWSSFHFLHSNVPDNKCHKEKCIACIEVSTSLQKYHPPLSFEVRPLNLQNVQVLFRYSPFYIGFSWWPPKNWIFQ